MLEVDVKSNNLVSDVVVKGTNDGTKLTLYSDTPLIHLKFVK